MVEKAKKQGSLCVAAGAQLSVSPQGFPRENITRSALETELRPLFTGQVFFAAEGLPRGDSPGATGVWAGLALLWLPASEAVVVIGVIASALALHEPIGLGEIAVLVFTLAGVALTTKDGALRMRRPSRA